MDNFTFVVGLLAILACILPFYLIYRNNKNHDKALLNSLQHLALEHNVKITEYDIWHDNIIAFDQEQRVLLFHRATHSTFNNYIIRLSEIKQCKKIEKTFVVKEGSVVTKVPSHIGIELSYKNTLATSLYLSFFEEEEGKYLNGEGPLMHKWHQKINRHLLQVKIAA